MKISEKDIIGIERILNQEPNLELMQKFGFTRPIELVSFVTIIADYYVSLSEKKSIVGPSLVDLAEQVKILCQKLDQDLPVNYDIN